MHACAFLFIMAVRNIELPFGSIMFSGPSMSVRPHVRTYVCTSRSRDRVISRWIPSKLESCMYLVELMN